MGQSGMMCGGQRYPRWWALSNKGLESDGARRLASLATVPRGSAPCRWAGGPAICSPLPAQG
jgi:hypothetical protein